MTALIEIEFAEGQYEIDDDGTVTVTFDPEDYNLIDEDDAEEHVDTDDVIDNMDDEDLIAELKKRSIEYVEENMEKFVQNIMDGSRAEVRIFLTDILRLSHLASNDEICNRILELI